jgi:hypothetical protein
MSSARQDSKGRNKRRWLKWIVVPLLALGFLVAAFYALLFIRIVPPISVRVVDALTGKSLAGVNVCMQATGLGLGGKQVLESNLKITGASGRVFFLPAIVNPGLLEKFDGYAIQITDPRSGFVQTCGPQLGFKQGPQPGQFPPQLADARRDGSEYFPVELVEQEAVPKNISWFPFLRGTNFVSFMTVNLFPVLASPEKCKQISPPGAFQECLRLNTMAQNALFQDVAPMYFAGMVRASIQITDERSPDNRVYTVVYQSNSTPERYIAVTIERFPKGQSAMEHFEDLTHAIPNYDPKDVTEEEPIPGQKFKRILSTQTPRAFWASNNRLIMITFLTQSPFDGLIAEQWLVRYPSAR